MSLFCNLLFCSTRDTRSENHGSRHGRCHKIRVDQLILDHIARLTHIFRPNALDIIASVIITRLKELSLIPLKLCHYLMITGGFKDGTETVFGRRRVEDFA